MKFPKYLEETGQTAYAFFTTHDLPKNGVYKASAGRSVDYKTAKRISAATGGVVSISEIME